MPLWYFNIITNRFMLAVTLALSWLALMYESWNATRIAKDD